MSLKELRPSVEGKYPIEFKNETEHVTCSGPETFYEFMTKASMAASKDKKTIVSMVNGGMLVFQVFRSNVVDGGNRFIVVSWLTNPPIMYYPYVKVQAPESKLPIRNIGIHGALQEIVDAMSARISGSLCWNANVHSSKNIIEISGPNGEMCTGRLHVGAPTHDQPHVYCGTSGVYTHLVLDAGGKGESIDLTHPRFEPDKKFYNNKNMKEGGHFWNDEYDKSWYNYSPVGGKLMGEIFTFCSTHFKSDASKKRKAKNDEGSKKRSEEGNKSKKAKSR